MIGFTSGCLLISDRPSGLLRAAIAKQRLFFFPRLRCSSRFQNKQKFVENTRDFLVPLRRHSRKWVVVVVCGRSWTVCLLHLPIAGRSWMARVSSYIHLLLRSLNHHRTSSLGIDHNVMTSL